VFRLCVLYHNLNAITRPFQFQILRCDDAVDNIGCSKFFLTLDLDSGYRQAKAGDAAKDKTAFFTLEGKKHWNVMPLGILNAHAFFVAMMTKFYIEWDAEFKRDPAASIAHMMRILEKRKEVVKAFGLEQMAKGFAARIHQATKESAPDLSTRQCTLCCFIEKVVVGVARQTGQGRPPEEGLHSGW
jgi:hypothetical protein